MSTVTKHGYVLVYVGKKHHLADCRGYVYEHRLVAEENLGRRLRPGEQIHHLDGDRANNKSENIRVMANLAAHRVLHRKAASTRRLPREPNIMVACKCGCGATFSHYDSAGRPRDYVSGHNPTEAPLQGKILELLGKEALHRDELARLCGSTSGNVGKALHRLRKKSLVMPIARGTWALRDSLEAKQFAARKQVTVSCACGCGTCFKLLDAYGRPRRFVSGHNLRKGSE